MKVAFIIPSLRNLGPIIVVHNIVALLSKKKEIEIKVFYFDYFVEVLPPFDCSGFVFFSFLPKLGPKFRQK